jgi:hypothetical protein
LVRLRARSSRPLIGVDDTHDFGLRMLLERVHQLLPAHARADDADGDAVAGSGTRGGRCGGEQRAGLQ